jgi:DGQHR domain-containing protein
MKSLKELVLKALPVQQRIGEFYVASVSARDLVEITFSDVRRLGSDPRDIERYLGIQRQISTKRVNEIKRYLEGGDATFPTAIIIAVDERCAEFDASTSRLTLHEFKVDSRSATDDEPIAYERLARVIDGQHRIAAFMDDTANWEFVDNETNRAFQLNVAIFVGADISEQANIFATVNLAQTKVSRSLVYDLTELADKRSPHKSCHEIAVMLDGEKRSPLFHRIKRLGTATPGRKNEPLTQAAFVESLIKFVSTDPVGDRNALLEGRRLKPATPDELRKAPLRNLFIASKELDIAEILHNYFSAVRDKWPNSWSDVSRSSNLLPKSNAFKALMKFLREDVYVEAIGGVYGQVPSAAKFARFFADIDLRDDDFTTRNFVPGSGGQSTFLKMLRGELRRKDLLES